MTVQTAVAKPLVVSPVPRDKWRSVLAGDPLALPEHSPEWIDALTDNGRYRDASRLYTFADGREAILPLVARRGLAGAGGWLLSYPSGWGMGGLVGNGIDADVARAVLEDLRQQHWQRVAIRPDPRRWQAWAEALDGDVLTIPRRAHVIELDGGVEGAWHGLSNSARRHVRTAEQHGVRIETGHSGALLQDYYSLFLASVDRWAGHQHEPRALAHARARLRDPLAKLQFIGRHLGEGFLVTLAYIDGKPAAGSITLYGRDGPLHAFGHGPGTGRRTGTGSLSNGRPSNWPANAGAPSTTWASPASRPRWHSSRRSSGPAPSTTPSCGWTGCRGPVPTPRCAARPSASWDSAMFERPQTSMRRPVDRFRPSNEC